MEATRTTRQKLMEWVRRYLPCEIAGTVGELGGAAAAYLLTGSMTAAAITATIGASVGYYAAAYVSAVRWAYRAQTHQEWAMRVVVANLLAVRSIAIEFGPAEIIDTILIRPLAYYLAPLMFGNVVVGWIFAKIVSDIGFYTFAVFSYERFNTLLAGRRPTIEEANGAPVPTVAAA